MTSCPSCSNPLPLSSNSEQLGAARCPSCNLLIDLSSGKAVVPRRVATNVVAPQKWKVDAPLPWRGRRSLSTADLTQRCVLEKRGRKGGISYELCAAMRDGTRQSLVRGLNDELDARFLEVRLEQLMNIIDAPVEREHRR